MINFNFKKISIWAITISLVISLSIIFITPFIFESFKDLSFRLLISFTIFFLTVIILLLISLLRKKETQEVLEERILRNEYKKIINKKIKSLKSKFNKALRIVKNSSIYRFKSKYELPWYLIMGEKLEGKTSFIESSGLNFPINYEDTYQNEEDEKFKWYFAEHSIFVDLPGNYIQQKDNPEDPIIWKYFLKFFIKRRWKRPINGIILAISIDTLQNKNNKELDNFAKNLRDRFDELSSAFMSSIPIYILITKTDKVEGFENYFNNLNGDEKDEILGVTFEEESLNDNNITQDFSSLLKRLNSSILDKMHFEWDLDNRGKIFLFTEKMSQILSKINYFVDTCFTETRYRKPLMLRGVYFTSIKKDYESSGKSKALFVKKLLENVIFEESEIGKIDENYKKKVKRNQIISYVASLTFLIFCGFFMMNNFINTNEKLNELENSYKEYSNLRNIVDYKSEFKDSNKLFNLVNKIQKDEFELRNNSFFNSFIFKYKDRSEELKRLYYSDLLRILLPQVANKIQNNITINLDDFSKTWDSTKAYLMLEILEKRDKDFLITYMSNDWNQTYSKDEILKNDLLSHWKYLLNEGFNSFDTSKQVIETARNRLIQLSAERLTYEDWKSKFSYLSSKDFSFEKVLGNNSSLFIGSDIKIPGLFTKLGYEAVVLDGKRVLNDILLNNWVIGQKVDLNEKEKDEYFEKIMSFYFNDYKTFWNEALINLNIISYDEIEKLNEQLAILTSSDSPILIILKHLKENTELYSSSEKVKDTLDINNQTISELTSNIALNKLDNFDVNSVSMIREFFKPYNDLLDEKYQSKNLLNTLFEEFNKTYEIMSNINGSVNFEEDAFKIVSNRVHGKVAPLLNQLKLMPPQVKKWYEVVMQGNLVFISKGAKSYINKKYRRMVLSFYKERIKGKYPADITNDDNFIKLDDFNEFFRKDGVLDNFYKEYISGFIDIDYEKSTARARNIDGNKLNFSKEFINSLIKAQNIRNVFFKNDGSFGTIFSIKPHTLGENLATAEITFDNTSIVYEHGPIIMKKINWPSDSLNSSVKLKLYDLSNKIVVEDYINNDWALFKFIDKSKNLTVKDDSLIVSFEKYDFKSSFEIGGVSRLYNSGNTLSFSIPNNI
ncbi:MULTISPECIES: type VI secretion system membrane subunit TssM [Arcobacter]|uniref:Type VI secretion system, membrane platform protein n=1 Tax=Arcobacter defluvii TaxID=873191 RepID=A0AAE7BGR4_9BACT|nr:MULTISPECIES: type VI secretion system membrane subunit TssM [Arcobacter]QKF78258.1 type VI secretion system, membrane platform protein [Arcobacter defluvii]RXI29065.1 type VI secretion system membrane subunit TssM [Arcobacter defluvii]BAK74054.1 conserved hypothetical protein [Arcobacter sp. L]